MTVQIRITGPVFDPQETGLALARLLAERKQPEEQPILIAHDPDYTERRPRGRHRRKP